VVERRNAQKIEWILARITILYSYKMEIRVAMIGPGGAGKTEILRRLSGEPFRPSYHPTHGSEIWAIDLQGIRFIVTEYSGQEQLRYVPKEELDAIQNYIMVTTESPVDLRSSEKLARKMPENIPSCWVVNKIDVKGTTHDLGCSAKRNFNLQEPFMRIAQMITQRENNETKENN
jgi:GTPase SAR1 family protein